ncbi:uncharacterized protein LOC132740804 [Ruditapes philippinarum]|uniref:uncharacterized protein LOC132740804 n=1 Tax=Ruditapes philippinarum TaxID=129788 RepID=UPI00295AC15A|nr:uncharacterized protein LOC132740804 [Ruditapes philippinarum]
MNKSKGVVLLLVCLAAYIQAQDYWTLPRCRRCHRVTSFEQCENYVVCDRNEACFVDELITESGIAVFEAGCRAIEVCKASGKKRKRGDLVACSKCCDGDDYCNDRLCGLKKESNLTLCNSCDGRDGRPQPPQYPEDCAYLRQCAPTEACFASTYMYDATSLRHYSTCRSKKICDNLMKYIFETYQTKALGKRNAGTICAVCCGDEQCNKYACETTKKRIRYLNLQERFNHTTLTEIPWSAT